MADFKIILGDCLDALKQLPAESVQCVVTSPPYWGLRDYGAEGQIGSEKQPGLYVTRIRAVFDEIKRVLRSDGTAWLNLGDTYQNKSLVGIPWRVAFGLIADGWLLRSEIIWAKPNPMPAPVKDRPTTAHEQLFLLTKSPKYYYDIEAVREPLSEATLKDAIRAKEKHGDALISELKKRGNIGAAPDRKDSEKTARISNNAFVNLSGRNKRTVWEIQPARFKGAHFATFPTALIEPCILAGSKADDTVLDPFSGAGTTGVVATKLNRNYIGIELNPEYAEMSRRRIAG